MLVDAGSPPRMRGKPPTQTPCTARARITPADAGKTQRDLRWGVQNGDHPRGCGENVAVDAAAARNSRITPADAGKTNAKYVT